jgi:hypothetical protein
MSSISIKNLVKRTDDLQKQMSLEIVKQASKLSGTYQRLVDELLQSFQGTAKDVKKILDQEEKTAADLPLRSRRAYQWISYLSKIENLQDHLDALQRLNLFTPAFLSISRLKKLKILFYQIGSLYKVRTKERCLEIVIQESYIQAPDSVLSAILETANTKSKHKARKIIQDYAFSKEFRDSRTRLEYLHIPPGFFAQGSSYNLDTSFKRVNQEYFGGKIPRPHLVWSSRLTYRKFGHYQWDIDTVLVSKTLDNKKVPDYLVDYVMYHELLHKKLGVRDVNGRRMAHTSEFRAAEEKYTRFKEAKKRLLRLSKKKS